LKGISNHVESFETGVEIFEKPESGYRLYPPAQNMSYQHVLDIYPFSGQIFPMRARIMIVFDGMPMPSPFSQLNTIFHDITSLRHFMRVTIPSLGRSLFLCSHATLDRTEGRSLLIPRPRSGTTR
jgi:hypothetical protein